MRRILPIFALLLAATAQQQPSPSTPTFTSRTELVTVPAVVLRAHNPMKQLDPHGWIDPHVTGLKQEDFQIEENGKPVKVASFEEVSASAKTARPIVPPPGVYTNEIGDEAPVSMLVIVVDTINTPYIFQENTKKKILDFLENDFKADRPTMLVVLHPDGLRVLHDFTTDPRVLAQIVKGLKRSVLHDASQDNQVMTVNDNAIGNFIDVKAEADALAREFMGDLTPQQKAVKDQQIDRLATTLFEMQQLAHALSAVRGMKTLVWATSGIILPMPNTQDSRASEAIDGYVQVLKLMTAAGVSIYPIDVTPEVINPIYSSPQARGARPHLVGMPSTQVLQNFMDVAKRTGGDYCLLRKDYDWCFRKAADYNAQFYLLSYYTHTSPKPEWRTIKVNVHGDHLDVRARTGFYSGMRQGDPEERRKSDIVQAFSGPVDYRGLAISVRWKDGDPRLSAKPADEPHLSMRPEKRTFILQIDPGAVTVEQTDKNHIELDVVAIATDAKGKALSDVTQHLTLHPTDADLAKMRRSLFAYSNALEISDTATSVKFIVRDGLNERIGTLTVPLR